MTTAAGSAYQSPVRRLSAGVQADKENSPLDVNHLKKLIKSTTDETKDVLAQLKNGTLIKMCKPLADIDKNTAATQKTLRKRKLAQAKDLAKNDAAKPKRALKKPTTDAKDTDMENQKPKRVRKATGAAAKEVNTTEESSTSTNQTSVLAKPKRAIKKTTAAKAEDEDKENEKPKRVRKPREAPAKKIITAELGTAINTTSVEAKPKRAYKKRTTAKPKKESVDNQNPQNEATNKNIKTGNKIDQLKTSTLGESKIDQLKASTLKGRKIDQFKASTQGGNKIDQLKTSTLGASKIDQLMSSTLEENKIDKLMASTGQNLNNVSIKSEPDIKHVCSSIKFGLPDSKVKKETAVKKEKCSVAKKLNISRDKTKKAMTSNDLNLSKNTTKPKRDYEQTMNNSSEFDLDSKPVQYKCAAEPGLSGLKISNHHVTVRGKKLKSKLAKEKKDKKAKDKFKNDIKVAKAIEKMSQYIANVNIGNMAGRELSSSLSECSTSCSCNDDLSSSDDSHCNCWNCQRETSSDDSSSTESSSDSSDDSNDSESTSSTESSSSSSDESKKHSRKSCKHYNLRNRCK